VQGGIEVREAHGVYRVKSKKPLSVSRNMQHENHWPKRCNHHQLDTPSTLCDIVLLLLLLLLRLLRRLLLLLHPYADINMTYVVDTIPPPSPSRPLMNPVKKPHIIRL
jgi:hypothetical protein